MKTKSEEEELRGEVGFSCIGGSSSKAKEIRGQGVISVLSLSL